MAGDSAMLLHCICGLEATKYRGEMGNIPSNPKCVGGFILPQCNYHDGKTTTNKRFEHTGQGQIEERNNRNNEQGPTLVVKTSNYHPAL
jgi:hypothetical protein